MRKLPLSVLLLAPLVALGIYACDQQPVEPELSVPDQQQGDLLATHVQNRNPFLGSWRMTSAVVGSEELFVGSSLQYIMTFRDEETCNEADPEFVAQKGCNGTFSVSISNDNGVEPLVCKDPPQTSCGWSGGYSYTGVTITSDHSNHPDPDEQGWDRFLYALCGGTFSYMGFDDDEVGVRLTFQRTGLGR